MTGDFLWVRPFMAVMTAYLSSEISAEVFQSQILNMRSEWVSNLRNDDISFEVGLMDIVFSALEWFGDDPEESEGNSTTEDEMREVISASVALLNYLGYRDQAGR